jgi:osmotically-inducible protein OsmY
MAYLPAQSDSKTVDTNRDSRKNGPTADDQKNNEGDRKMTADIRRAVVGDKSLSTSAHNIKIITRNGAVTLRGRVKSEDEKKAVVAKAEEVAGHGKVTDELQISQAKMTSREKQPDK